MFLSFADNSPNDIKLNSRRMLFLRSPEDLNNLKDQSVAIVVDGGFGQNLGVKSGISSSGCLIIDKPGEFGLEDVSITTGIGPDGKILPRMSVASGIDLFYLLGLSKLQLEDLLANGILDEASGEASIVLADLSVIDHEDIEFSVGLLLNLIKKMDNPKLIISGSSSLMSSIREYAKHSGIDNLEAKSVDEFKLKKAQDAINMDRVTLLY